MGQGIILTDADRSAIAELDDYALDLAYGDDENDFELTLPDDAPLIGDGSIAYIEGTAYGGIVDSIASKVKRDGCSTVYSGRTWSGVLASRIVVPPTGSTHYTWAGEANACIRDLIARLGLQDLITAPTSDSGIEVDSRFERFCDAWSGMVSALGSCGARPQIRCIGGMVTIEAVERTDWGDEIDSDLIDFDIEQVYRCTNHLVCAGTGEMEDRAVVHFYADSTGAVSHIQSLYGDDEISELYEYSTADEEQLEEDGAKRLAELQDGGDISVTVRDDGPEMEVGDTVMGRDHRIGVSVSATVSKKIVKASRGTISVSYEVSGARAI